jgi:hypothetical protein
MLDQKHLEIDVDDNKRNRNKQFSRMRKEKLISKFLSYSPIPLKYEHSSTF